MLICLTWDCISMKLVRKIHHLLHPKVGEIWCLHRVVNNRSIFLSNRDLEVTTPYFESLIVEKLSQGFRFVDIDTFIATSESHWKGHKLINVSFDDGYQDVFDNAYPILRKYGIPFTVYVTTDMPDGEADLWWLQMEQLANKDTLFFEQLMSQIYASNVDFGLAMHQLTGTSKDSRLCRKYSLSWQGLLELSKDRLCTIGSHCVSHSAMPLLKPDKWLNQLQGSKSRLESMLGIQVNHFSYPHSLFNLDINELVLNVGYQSAVIGYGDYTRHHMGSKLFYRKNIVEL